MATDTAVFGEAVDTKAFETICSGLESVDLVHTINDGKVLEMCLYDDGPAVFMIVEADTDSQLTVEIPKTMVYSVNQGCNFTGVDIISDWGFPSVTMEDTAFTRIFTIDIPKGYYNEIEVYSSYTLGDDVHQYCGEIYGYDSQYLPPKKQVDKGRLSEHVRCNEGLELIFKSTDGSPACVTGETGIKLEDRGWSVMVSPLVYNNEADCFAAGGEWYPSDGVHVLESFCNLPTADGGKQCTDSSQCESYCQATDEAEVGSHDTGMCYEKQFSTCMKLVIEGVVKGQLCS